MGIGLSLGLGSAGFMGLTPSERLYQVNGLYG